MLSKSIVGRLGTAAFIGGIGCLGLSQSTTVIPKAAAVVSRPPADVQTDALRNREIGFVVSDIHWGLGPDAAKSGACPDGMSRNLREIFEATPDGHRRDGESEEAYAARSRAATAAAPNGQNVCLSPEAYGPDPNFRTVTGPNISTFGIDLDGRDSRSGVQPAAGTCAHEDFRGVNGERGIDNQFYRLVGCSKGFQSTGAHLVFAEGMRTGSWGIVIKLKGVDNLTNDNDVDVGIYANGDPIQLSPARTALSYATYAVSANPKYGAHTRGRIVNGVLMTDPVNVRFPMDTNNIHLERPLDGARLRMTITKDGGLDGIMAGYTKVDELFDFFMAFRNGKTADGKPAAARTIAGSSAGSSSSAGMTCNGVYFAMKQLADGERDPKTGKCGAVSTQYRITAVPAFIVDTPAPTNIAKAN